MKKKSLMGKSTHRYPPGRVSTLTEEQRTSLRAELMRPQGFSIDKEIQLHIAEPFAGPDSIKYQGR